MIWLSLNFDFFISSIFNEMDTGTNGTNLNLMMTNSLPFKGRVGVGMGMGMG